MSQNEPYPGTQAVLRAIALLKAFTGSRNQLTLTDLARAAQLKKTTAYRLLTALESEGMVSRDLESETYLLGPAILTLGGRALRSNDLRTASQPELERLSQETRETATLEILVEGEVLIIDEVLGSHLIGAAPSIGTRWPVHATSTGKVLLAGLPLDERRLLFQDPLPSITGNTLVRIEDLEKELKESVEQGYAVAVEELEAGFVAVGAPVRNHEGRVVAAVSVGGPAARLTPPRMAEITSLLKGSAARISASLGYLPD